MTMDKLFRTAIEGGLQEGAGHTFVSANTYWVVWLDLGKRKYSVSTSIYFLNPSFWQALGKAMGSSDWYDCGEPCLTCKGKKVPVCDPSDHIEGWKYRWHKFIDHLASGGNISDYFAQLTK